MLNQSNYELIENHVPVQITSKKSQDTQKIPLIYVLHSSQLYGTEKMALITIEGLLEQYQPIIFAPPGPLLAEAQRQGITIECFHNSRQLGLQLRPYLAKYHQLAFIATGVSHSILFTLWNLVYRRRVVHLHLVHGGTDERLSYGRKRILNHFPVKLVANSQFVQERLEFHGVSRDNIKVVENFLTGSQIESLPKRQPFVESGVKRIVIVSRLDPIKRVDLLFDALDAVPELGEFEFRLLGTGSNMKQIMERSTHHPNTFVEGFSEQVGEVMANSDLLLHLCPVEPFGLVILEAMAVGIPVLVPNQGGASSIVEPEVSGFHFTANDPLDLAHCLLKLRQAPADLLNKMVTNAHQRLTSQFSQSRGVISYRQLLKMDEANMT